MIPNIELFDESLDINSTANYDLSIEVSEDRLSFCLHDSIRNKFVLLRSFSAADDTKFCPEEIDEIIAKDDFLNSSYKSTRIVMPAASCTLVPSPLFDPAHRDDYFNFNQIPDERKIILNNKVINPDAYIVFSVTKAIFTILTDKFEGSAVMHHLKPLLLKVPVVLTAGSEKYIQLHVEKDFFNLIIFIDRKLRFCNTFSYRNVSDILYYVLYTFNNTGITQDETMFISGYSEPFDELHSNMQQYIRSVKFSIPSASSSYSYVFNDIGLHRFINLFNATHCE